MRRLLLSAVGVVLCAGFACAQPCVDVKVFAGRDVGDGGPAVQAILDSPRNVILDAAGNIFVADAGHARIRRIDPAGTITTVAGNGAPGIAKDGDQALLATLKEPSGVALIGGDLLIADIGESVNTVWRVTADGILHRFAGSGVATGSIDGPGGDPADDLNDGQQAVFATLNLPARVAVDAAGNVFIADFGNGLVRRVDAATGKMSTVASGLAGPIGVAIGAGTDLFIANTGTNQYLKGSTTGGPTAVFAGNGTAGVALDRDTDPPVAADHAPLDGAAEVAVDGTGVVYIGDALNNVIHKVTTDGIIHRVAGSGIPGSQDGPDFLARFRSPGVALGGGQTLIVPDVDNNRIRRFDPAATVQVTTIAGGDNPSGDGGPATAAILNRPAGLAVDAGGNVIVSEHDSHRIRRIDSAGTITTLVNRDAANDSATDGVAAVNSPLRQPTGVAFDGAGELLIADAKDHRVLIVDGAGTIRTFAGGANTPGFAGDGGPATSALLNTPLRIVVASDGSVYIADFNNNRIRKVDPSGTIGTVAGNGGELNQPAGLVFDGGGNLYIADFGSNRVLKLDPSGGLTAIAGSGTPGRLGDNGSAGAAQLQGPTDVAFAADGALLIVDNLNNVIRYVAPGGDGRVGPGSTITTIIGDGRPTFADGPGTRASLLFPTDVALDPSGNILIADRGNQRVRVTTPGNDCAPAGTPCSSAAQCDDTDPCTLDACTAANVCSHTALSAAECHPTCSSAPDGCIRGGGPARVDCLAEVVVRGAQAARPSAPVVRCHDGDQTCDFDPAPGRCGFLVAWCLNEGGCKASGVSKFAARGAAAPAILQAVAKLAPSSPAGPAMVFAEPVTATESCSELVSLSVGLRKNGRRPGKLAVKTVAFGTSKRVRDVDKIKFVCLP